MVDRDSNAGGFLRVPIVLVTQEPRGQTRFTRTRHHTGCQVRNGAGPFVMTHDLTRSGGHGWSGCVIGTNVL